MLKGMGALMLKNKNNSNCDVVPRERRCKNVFGAVPLPRRTAPRRRSPGVPYRPVGPYKPVAPICGPKYGW